MDTKISKVKLGNNNFTDPSSFCELLRTNGSSLTHLDFSKMMFDLTQKAQGPSAAGGGQV